MSPDVPYVRREGSDQQVAMHNRISAIKRIEFLCGVDLNRKSKDYKKLVDAIMFDRWYKDYPSDHKIDEEWCQRAASVVRELETKTVSDLSALEEAADERVKFLYEEAKNKPSIPIEHLPEPPKVHPIKSFFAKIFKKETHGA